MSIINTLVTDRTEADVARWLALRNKGYGNMTIGEQYEWSVGMKGAYNPHIDMNRVGKALNYLRDKLAEQGYLLPDIFTAKTDWAEGDIPTATQLAEYLYFVSIIRNALAVFPSTPAVPPNTGGLTHVEANDIEKILVDVDTLINKMLASCYYLGELFCGEV